MNLLEAIEAVKRISPDSPFYTEAQDSLIKWQQKAGRYGAATVCQLARPNWPALNLPHGDRQGPSKITQERPQRLQAQTLSFPLGKRN